MGPRILKSEPFLRTHRYRDAAEFVQAIRPCHANWGPDPQDWIFRGHAVADWPLIPAAFRPGALVPFDSMDPTTATEGMRFATEQGLLRQFGEALDGIGWPLPGTSRAQLSQLEPRSDVSPQWIRAAVELAALAQHYGLPTRLLDFTERAYVAAYFAALPPKEPAAGKELCVWAVRRDYLKLGEQTSGVWFSEIRASRAANPHLHAQSGLFVTWTGPDRVVSLDTLLSRAAGDNPRNRGKYPAYSTRPVMYKLTLHRRYAAELLGLLADERVTGSTMFPSPAGAVLELKERTTHRRWMRLR